MKLATVTASVQELRELVPLLRELYFHGGTEVLSLVCTGQESALLANPVVHRRLREYTDEAIPENRVLQGEDLVAAARRALLEERPDLVLWPSNTFLKQALHATVRQLGIGEYQLEPATAVTAEALYQKLRSLDENTNPLVPGKVQPEHFMEPHWSTLGEKLESPCLVKTTPALGRMLRERFGGIDFHDEPERESYPCGLSLMFSSYSESPAEDLQALRALCNKTLSLEPVNSPLVGARFNLRYGLFDNEFALAAADLDLKPELGSGHRTVVWDPRKGQAGPHSPPHPDGHYPAFFTTWSDGEGDWTSRFAIPKGEELKIVFADSGNVASSALHHAQAINQYTKSKAWALCRAPHPFIGPRLSDETSLFLNSAEQHERAKELLSEADCVVFFEDDDESSPSWPFSLSPYLADTAVLHLYIGYRVHQKKPQFMREGRRILTPLPHLLKMYPESHFYAGFPPLVLTEKEAVPPQSATDGICRFLHTPSRPHWTTSRYPYHKDTEAYLEAARTLRKRHGKKVEFHQVGGWSHCEVIKARQYCDVTFNQLRGFHGLSGDEAMMLGRPCVQFFDQFNINRHLEYWGLEVDFPWLSCRRDSLVDTFEELILSPELRAEIGEHSREFMRKYFSPEKGILPLLYHCYRAVQEGPKLRPERGLVGRE